MSKLLTWNEYVRLALSYATFNRNEDGSWTVGNHCVAWVRDLGRNARRGSGHGRGRRGGLADDRLALWG